MGGKSESEIKTTIRNEISAELSAKVNNFTKNVNTSISENTMNVANEMVNEFKNKSSAEALASNILEDVVIIASKGAKIDINQDASAKLEMAAIVNILSSNEQKNDLGNKVSTAMENAIKNDSQLKAEMAQAAKIDKKSSESGGFAKMLDSIMDSLGGMIQNLTGGSSSQTNETDIRNTIKTKVETEINNTNINENEFINKMSVEIKNSFKNMTQDECMGSAQSRNMAKKMRFMADEGAEIKVMQVAKTDAIAKCISTKKIGNKALSGITNDAGFKAASNTGNTSDLDAASKQDASSSDTKESRDAITDGVVTLGEDVVDGAVTLGENAMDNMASTTQMIIIAITLLLIAGGCALYFIIKGSSDNPSFEMPSFEMPNLKKSGKSGLRGGFNLEEISKLIDVPLAQRGITLIVAVFVIDMILKKTKSKN